MRFAWLVLVVVVCLVAGCDNPAHIDRDTEISIGRQGAADLEKQYGVVHDSAMQRRLGGIGRRLASVSAEPSYPWSFKVLNSTEINAVCLPGGFVYVFKGMMDYVRSDDELAGVVGHEVAHADHHHAKAAIEKAMTAGLLVELVTQKSSASVQQAAKIALDLEMRQGYREKEYEADHFGTEYAFRAGYRARGLRSMLEYLYEKEGDPARITWLLQSHPPLAKRVERLDEYIPMLTGRPLADD